MKSGDLPDLHKRAWAGLLVSHALLTRKINLGLQSCGVLSLEEYDVLLALELSEFHRLRMSELAQEIVFTPSGLTRLVERLESRGFVRRERCSVDRRCMNCFLLPAGQKARENTWPTYAALIGEHFANHINQRDAATLRRIFANLIKDRSHPFA